MKPKFTLFILLYMQLSLGYGQLQSPAEFLGHAVGAKITPHSRVLAYYDYIAEQFPGQVKAHQYGRSVEGRPLYAYFISSEAHISRLEDLRQQNLRLAQSAEGSASRSGMPAILWMSNNVHGNETSSAEASMMTLYELVNPANASTKAALANTVVVLDPCLNPDGTERYNNWQNSVLGSRYYPDLYAREHQEPWPSGRLNHYYFDLNRDWAWQTQVESQQRVAFYNSWLPHIHADFHEQGINAPYYFPPAAEPLHEVITPWQRSFQRAIGQHNAEYFDQKGWLYFTKERFDLFYPSYGDTYPMYAGAIGMTYEKAGNGSAGLGVYTNDRDTLTLVDRAIQHHASAMNMLSKVSAHAEEVVTHFERYYADAVSGKLSSYDHYIIRYQAESAAKIRALTALLDKNNIRYFSGSGRVKGLDYRSRKEVSYSIGAQDLVIPGAQAKGALVRVLFEPEAKLSDSVTYDITAWSLPYVYGLGAVAATTKDVTLTAYQGQKPVNTLTSSYGYAFKWDSFASAQLLSALLQQKIQVRSSEVSFSVGGETFPAGSIIVLQQANKEKAIEAALQQYGDAYGVQLYGLSSGVLSGGKDVGSSEVRTVKAPRVLMFASEEQRALNVGEVWHYMDQQLGYPIILSNAKSFNTIKWAEIDIFIMPRGNYPFLKDKVQAEHFQRWLEGGGKVIALENAVAALSGQPWSALKAVAQDSAAKAKESVLLNFGDRERSALKSYTAGAIYEMTFDKSHPLMFGAQEYYTLKQDAVLYQYMKEGKGWNVGYIKEDARVSGFVGEKLHKQLKNGLILGTQSVGSGSVVYIVDNVLFRNFWESGKLVMANALFQVK